jgi:hypothetical protein
MTADAERALVKVIGTHRIAQWNDKWYRQRWQVTRALRKAARL